MMKLKSKILKKEGKWILNVKYRKGKVGYKEVYRNDNLIEKLFDEKKQFIGL